MSIKLDIQIQNNHGDSLCKTLNDKPSNLITQLEELWIENLNFPVDALSEIVIFMHTSISTASQGVINKFHTIINNTYTIHIHIYNTQI